LSGQLQKIMIQTKQKLLSNKHTGFENLVTLKDISSLPSLADFFFAYLGSLSEKSINRRQHKEYIKSSMQIHCHQVAKYQSKHKVKKTPIYLFVNSWCPCLLRLCVAALAEQGRQAG